MISVVVADDQTLVRGGFRALVDAQTDMSVVGEAADGAEAVRQTKLYKPDVVLMDIRMPELDGLAATKEIFEAASAETRVIILTTFDLDEYVFEALRIGASGFLVKDTEPDVLLQAIRSVVKGDALLSPNVTRKLIEEFASRAKEPPAISRQLEHLTEREREVVALVGQGLTNDEIGERLFISGATAKTHVSRSMIKLGARDRAQLVVIAYESGLVRPGWS